MLKFTLVIAIVAIVCFCGENLAAQTADGNGFVIGQITERISGQPIANARIAIKNVAEARSQADGQFSLSVKAGVYNVKIAADNFSSIIKNQIGVTRFCGFNVAATYRLASGLPNTRRTPIEILPNVAFYVQRVAKQSDINALRLLNFASLDVRAEKRFNFKRWSFAPYVDYFNITNHNSVVQPTYEFFPRDPQFLNENQRLPIFGARVEF